MHFNKEPEHWVLDFDTLVKKPKSWLVKDVNGKSKLLKSEFSLSSTTKENQELLESEFTS